MRRSRMLLLPAAAGAAAAGVWFWVNQRGRRLAKELRNSPGEWPQQTPAQGRGPLFFRSYHIDILNPQVEPEELMRRVQADPDAFTPGEIARFEKTCGDPDRMSEGDEYYIHIRAPWDGPVRVAEVREDGFRLVTLRGHMEAGAIRFRFLDRPQGVLRFEIASCARSAGPVVHAAYDKLPVARGGQQLMWTRFCQKVAEASGGAVEEGVQVHTFRARYEDPLTPGDAEEPSPYENVLADLAARALNFEPPEAEPAEEGWNQDDDEVQLIPEPPGPPLDGGSWAHAREFVEAYRFPDPRLIQGHYDREAPLEGRSMLLRGRFLGFHFPFGVRISRTFDEIRDTDEGPLRAWGYSYRTLEHHFERGEITFLVGKYLESGRVVFRIHSYSRRAHIPNVLFRAGFRIFGRRLQRRFAGSALARTRDYVEERLVREACLDADRQATWLLLRDFVVDGDTPVKPPAEAAADAETAAAGPDVPGAMDDAGGSREETSEASSTDPPSGP